MKPTSKSPLTSVIDELASVRSRLVSPDLLAVLAQISVPEAEAFRGALLRVVAWLDDSVSNPYLGSIFDRTGDDPLNQMLKGIATAYGVRATFAGTTGTTGLNAPAVMTLAREGEEIGIGRDCHVSVIGGLTLSGAAPAYIVPPFDPLAGVLLPPSRDAVATFLDDHPALVALVLTMPTYHGLMGDVAGITAECHARGVRLMVDGAHGPHYHFLAGLGFPVPAEDVGADIVTQSSHKVMSALNQGSLLHLNDLDLIPIYEEFQSLGFQSTSFSYPILMSIEHAVQQMVANGPSMWRGAVGRAARIREGAAILPGVEVLGAECVDGSRVRGLDPTRVTLNVRTTGLTGYDAADALLDSGLLVEMASPDAILLFVSPSVTDEMVEQTLQVLEDTVRTRGGGKPAAVFEPPALPDRVLTPRQAAMSPTRERVPTVEAVGRVSAETIGCYPPGQAILVAGERITRSGIDYLRRAVEAGGHLKRVQDDDFRTITVIRETE